MRFVFAIALLLAGCGQLSTDTPSSDTGGGGSGGGATVPAVTTHVSIVLKTTWEAGSTATEWGTCTIDEDSLASPAINTCSIAVPEAQLYFSGVAFAVTVPSGSDCQYLGFRPYYYVRSKNAAYRPWGASADIDCSALATTSFGSASAAPLGCYGGAAKEIVSGFGTTNFGKYTVGDGTTTTYTTTAANTVRQNSGEYITNTYVSNNLANTAVAVTRNTAIGVTGHVYGDDYDGLDQDGNPQWQDWEFVCKNVYDETLYRLKIYLSDTDSVTDTKYDWE